MPHHQSPVTSHRMILRIILQIYRNISQHFVIILLYSIQRISVQSFILKTGNIDDSMMWPIIQWLTLETWLKNVPANGKPTEKRQKYEFCWYFDDFVFSVFNNNNTFYKPIKVIKINSNSDSPFPGIKVANQRIFGSNRFFEKLSKIIKKNYQKM